MKLELKHLAPYLPYKLKAVDYFEGMKLEREIVPSNIMAFVDDDTRAKPILYPLSDITKFREDLGFVPIEKLFDLNYPANRSEKYIHSHQINYVRCFQKNSLYHKIIYLNYELLGRNMFSDVQKLYEWHFDVHGLIENGLAIDINTLKND